MSNTTYIDALNVDAVEMKEFISGLLDTASELVADERFVEAMNIMGQVASDMETLTFIFEEEDLPDLSDISERVVMLGDLITMAIEQKNAGQSQAA